MRSPSFATLARKELRELAASRAYWILLLLIGPLTGHAFITAVDAYAEASGIGGGGAALASALTPLDGIFTPTFGAYDLAVTLLYPFVAIRLLSAELESGAWKLMVQTPASVMALLAAKAAALFAGWLVAWIPAVIAIALWKSYGGAMHGPEIATLLLGHLLRFAVATGVALAAAAATRGGSSAAIVTLAFTVGTWALDFAAAGQGGIVREIAANTPSAILRGFEHGLLSLNAAAVSAILAAAGLAFAAICLSSENRLKTAVALAVLLCSTAFMHASWDFSENRRNSFAPADQAALRVAPPLRVTINLAAEDPRLADFENVLAKLNRTVPRLDVVYAARSRSGLFEGDRYGEIWYEANGRRAMNRAATTAIVLDTIYRVAGIQPPPRGSGADFAGHPLAARPDGAAWIYYLLWPCGIAVAWWFVNKE